MADKIFDSGVLPEIAVTDTTPIPAINGSGLWTKITGLGIKTYQNLLNSLVSTNINTIVTPGNYCAQSTCTNLPEAVKTRMRVSVDPTNSSNILQEGVTTTTEVSYIRKSTNGGSSWSAWARIKAEDETKELLTNKSTSVTTDQASNTKYPSVKSVYDWAVGAFAKYLGDADFYQYSISRTVSGGNLTVALKNYEGNDPTATKPVKIRNADGTIRTITSSCTATITFNDFYHFNAGSTELATLEIDYCVYIAKFGGPLISRKFHYSKISDGSGGGELTVSNTGGFSGTDTFVPVGRFNAIKASGASGNWSVPATSDIRNYPILQTRYLDYTPVGAGYTAGGAKYRVDGNNVNIIIDSTANITGNITVPFTCTNTVDNQMITSAGTAVLPKNSATITVATNPQNISGFYGI